MALLLFALLLSVCAGLATRFPVAAVHNGNLRRQKRFAKPDHVLDFVQQCQA